MTDSEIKELIEAAKEFETALKTKDVTIYAEADVKFHDIIYRTTDNQRLIQLLYNLREQMYRYRVEYLKDEEEQAIKKPLSENEERLKQIYEMTADLSDDDINLLKAFAAGLKANRKGD